MQWNSKKAQRRKSQQRECNILFTINHALLFSFSAFFSFYLTLFLSLYEFPAQNILTESTYIFSNFEVSRLGVDRNPSTLRLSISPFRDDFCHKLVLLLSCVSSNFSLSLANTCLRIVNVRRLPESILEPENSYFGAR